MSGVTQTVLIIEDDEIQRNVLSERIRAEGFKVVEATDGKKGLEVANDQQPDIILLDNRMPEMSGYEMLRRLRESSPWGAHVAVIFFSNIEPASSEEKEDLEAIMPTAYLLKGDTDLNAIVAKIKETLLGS